MAKGMMEMSHEMTLMLAEPWNLRTANKALSKRRRAKKTHLRQGGTLNQVEVSQILADKEPEAQEKRKKSAARVEMVVVRKGDRRLPRSMSSVTALVIMHEPIRSMKKCRLYTVAIRLY